MDKPDPQQPGAEPYNVYRYNAKRWNPTPAGSDSAAAGGYDMGFRRYDPGLNRFLARDLYTGALADQNLTTDAWTSNRYAFAAGNPVTGIELDGHATCAGDGTGRCVASNGDRVGDYSVDQTLHWEGLNTNDGDGDGGGGGTGDGGDEAVVGQA